MKKTLIGFVAALAVVALALPFANAGTKGTWTGWVTDEHCAAKGAKAEHKDCAMKCIENGGKLVFYNTADEKIYSLDNQAVAKEHLGHEVKVTGEAEAADIKVEKIEMAEANHAGH